jgi:hypothetical protein
MKNYLSFGGGVNSVAMLLLFHISERSMIMEESLKELYYEADTRKHQQFVARLLIAAAKRMLARAVSHDKSKLKEPERSHYVGPVYALNTEAVPYGSERYKELTAQMGAGWDHHKSVNDHHIEFFVPFSVQTLNDPVRAMDLFALLEMLADWIAASQRRGNAPVQALAIMKRKYPIDEQLEAIIRNTLALMEQDK